MPIRKKQLIFTNTEYVFCKKQSQVAQAKRDFELKKATYDTEVWPIFSSRFHGNLNHITDLNLLLWTQVNTAKAEAEMAYQLQASKVNARIKEEEMQVGTRFNR